MSVQKNPNPTNSSCMQALLDIRQALLAAGEPCTEIDAALTVLHKKKAVQIAADDLFDGHRYPDKALTYSKTARFGECRAMQTLSQGAFKVLHLFISAMSQDGLVQLSAKAIATAAGLSKPTVLNALAELENGGFIAVYKPAVQRQAAVYLINPVVAECGRGSAVQAEFKKLADRNLLQWQRLQQVNSDLEVAYIACKEENRTVRIGTLVQSAEQKKSSALDPADDFSEIDNMFPTD